MQVLKSHMWILQYQDLDDAHSGHPRCTVWAGTRMVLGPWFWALDIVHEV